MRNKKIVFFTLHSMNPPHPRIKMEVDILKKNGYDVVYQSLVKIKLEYRFFNKLFLGQLLNPLFRHKAAQYILDNYSEYDTMVFYDLNLLGLAYDLKMKCKKKRIIYETIDDNWSLTLYAIFRKLGKYYNYLERFLLPLCRHIEFYYSKKCDSTIVNSDGLYQIFSPNAHLLYYSSIFTKKLNQNINNESAILFIGAFDESKGAITFLNFAKNNHLPAFIFGSTTEKLKYQISRQESVSFEDYMSAEELYAKLQIITEKYFLYGFSCIEGIHNSYRIQLANKEVDYLALNAPIIGNNRIPTYDIIQRGAGLLLTDDIIEKMNSLQVRQKLVNNCRILTELRYSLNRFEKELIHVFEG